ncbi:hypothetical protein HMPREF0454_03109 [Hafnia alvei ATCC 51873]|uniref:Uncharacterized protein n=1 Tax=Hafnia alvei ATCC 51873 TaxID=1002364 RepID=G9Y9E0_HAFAL|nr:hypothetical protein HMPREF0454_03109 [Hafnia alvei ATCC 51873]
MKKLLKYFAQKYVFAALFFSDKVKLRPINIELEILLEDMDR